MTQNTLLTQEGHIRLTQELADLKQKQQHLVIQIEEVAQPDESGEDGLAQQLKEELEVVIAKIEKLETSINNAKILNKQKINCDVVQLGCTVTLKLSSSEQREFQIVDELEADPSQNRISYISPTGQALLGKKINQEIEVEAPIGKISYKIISIN